MPRIELHPHARERLEERGATEAEVFETVVSGRQFSAKFGRMGFRKTFVYGKIWRNRLYASKDVEAIAVQTFSGLLILTVITRYH